MRERQKERKEETLLRLAAEFVRLEATPASLITITRVELNDSGKDARIYFTTLPESEQDTAEKFLIRKMPEFKAHIRDRSRIGILPHLSWKIDYGERNRQRLDELSKEIE